MYFIIFITFFITISVIISLGYIFDYNLFYTIREIAATNQVWLFFFGSLFFNGILSIINCRDSNPLKVSLRRNFSTDYRGKYSTVDRVFLFYLTNFFCYYMVQFIYYLFHYAWESGLMYEQMAFDCFVIHLLGLLYYIYWCFTRNKLHQSSVLLIVLLLGFFIPCTLLPSTYFFNLESLRIFSGEDEVIQHLIRNLALTFNTCRELDSYLFICIFWYEALWTTYLRSLRFDEEFSKTTKFFIFLVLLCVTVNTFVIFYLFDLTIYSDAVEGMFFTYLLWSSVVLKILLLFR